MARIKGDKWKQKLLTESENLFKFSRETLIRSRDIQRHSLLYITCEDDSQTPRQDQVNLALPSTESQTNLNSMKLAILSKDNPFSASQK